MRPFDELTPVGRVRRLRGLALAATGRYGLEPGAVRCSFVAESFNTVFRVDSDRGRWALRVGPALRIHAGGTEAAEAAWTAALRSEAGVPVADLVPAQDGSPAVHRSVAGVPGERTCTAFRWVAGRLLAAHLTEDAVRRLGRLAAILHDHAASTAAGDGADVLVADRVLYWRVSNRLGELRAGHGALFDEALARAEEVVAGLWADPPHRPHLVHGDLLPANVLVEGGGLVPIDFQDMVVGFDVQDLSITLAALTGADPTGRLGAAFRSGYAATRPWPGPDGDLLDGLVAARRLHQLNVGLHRRRPGLDGYVARAAAAIRRWMDGSPA